MIETESMIMPLFLYLLACCIVIGIVLLFMHFVSEIIHLLPPCPLTPSLCLLVNKSQKIC